VLVVLQTSVNLGMSFNLLKVVIHNMRHIHLLHVQTLYIVFTKQQLRFSKVKLNVTITTVSVNLC